MLETEKLRKKTPIMFVSHGVFVLCICDDAEKKALVRGKSASKTPIMFKRHGVVLCGK